MNRKRVAVALSGGVDSSVAAFLLLQGGYEVAGFHMRLWCSPRLDYQARRAKNICCILKIPYHEVDLHKEFESRVVEYFVEEYKRGRTPNPCVACNKHIKFSLLLDKAFSLGYEYLATGHYARVEESNNRYQLFEAEDLNRDQSYFLYTLTQERLKFVLFPLGKYTREQVREIAKKAGLPLAARSSQDLCFISEKNYRIFLQERISSSPGDIVDVSGKKLGEHQGIAFYTIGQRHGLGIALGKPLYVIRIEPEYNRIVVGSEEELYSDRLTVKNVNWIKGEAPLCPIALKVKVRYKSKGAEAVVFPEDDSAHVCFSQAQKAVTPGQVAVFYQGSEVIGGGIIAEVGKC
jgi:tRNA-specific 2-thiouridylase